MFSKKTLVSLVVFLVSVQDVSASPVREVIRPTPNAGVKARSSSMMIVMPSGNMTIPMPTGAIKPTGVTPTAKTAPTPGDNEFYDSEDEDDEGEGDNGPRPQSSGGLSTSKPSKSMSAMPSKAKSMSASATPCTSQLYLPTDIPPNLYHLPWPP